MLGFVTWGHKCNRKPKAFHPTVREDNSPKRYRRPIRERHPTTPDEGPHAEVALEDQYLEPAICFGGTIYFGFWIHRNLIHANPGNVVSYTTIDPSTQLGSALL